MSEHETHRDGDDEGWVDALETALTALCAEPGTTGRSLGKAELIAWLAGIPGRDPELVFDRIRAAAKGDGRLGRVRVRAHGKARGTRYAFSPWDPGDEEHRPTESTGAPPSAPGGVRDFAIPACPPGAGRITVYQGDNLEVTRGFPDGSFDLIYVDPPFNTGHAQSRIRIRTDRDDSGDRVGFQGQRYRTTVIGSSAYDDRFDDYMAFLLPRLGEAHRLLAPTGSFFLHLDYREVHYAKVALDEIFGRDAFANEIIWSYDYGARATNRWSPKHDNILWYAKTPGDYCFNYDEIDRIPYLAPSLVGAEKAARGKTPTDSWWHTIVSPNGKEKTGYPTQKPLGILSRIVRVHSRPGERLLDFFAGSGSFGEAGANLGRDVVLVDSAPEAIAVMRRRFASFQAEFLGEAEGPVPHTEP